MKVFVLLVLLFLLIGVIKIWTESNPKDTFAPIRRRDSHIHHYPIVYHEPGNMISSNLSKELKKIGSTDFAHRYRDHYYHSHYHTHPAHFKIKPTVIKPKVEKVKEVEIKKEPEVFEPEEIDEDDLVEEVEGVESVERVEEMEPDMEEEVEQGEELPITTPSRKKEKKQVKQPKLTDLEQKVFIYNKGNYFMFDFNHVNGSFLPVLVPEKSYFILSLADMHGRMTFFLESVAYPNSFLTYVDYAGDVYNRYNRKNQDFVENFALSYDYGWSNDLDDGICNVDSCSFEEPEPELKPESKSRPKKKPKRKKRKIVVEEEEENIFQESRPGDPSYQEEEEERKEIPKLEDRGAEHKESKEGKGKAVILLTKHSENMSNFVFKIVPSLDGHTDLVSLIPFNLADKGYFLYRDETTLTIRQRSNQGITHHNDFVNERASFNLGVPYPYLAKIFW